MYVWQTIGQPLQVSQRLHSVFVVSSLLPPIPGDKEKTAVHSQAHQKAAGQPEQDRGSKITGGALWD